MSDTSSSSTVSGNPPCPGEPLRVLIAEDDAASALVLERMLRDAGHKVTVQPDGRRALWAARTEPFDVLLTDWMMPQMDGMELVHKVRQHVRPAPLIIVVTALGKDGRQRALSAGADDYLTKPYDPETVLATLRACQARRCQPQPQSKLQPEPQRPQRTVPVSSAPPPPFVAVCIAASTGGPDAVTQVFHGLPPTKAAAFFIVVHGPAWMLESFVPRLQRETTLKVMLGREGMPVKPGEVYLAPGDRHMHVVIDREARGGPTQLPTTALLTPGSRVAPRASEAVGTALIDPLRLRISADPPENFVRPSADPLFRSIAEVFGRRAVAVVLTGLGCDGAAGAGQVAAAGGVVLVQDPQTAVVSSMPDAAIKLGVARSIAGLPALAGLIFSNVTALSEGGKAM